MSLERSDNTRSAVNSSQRSLLLGSQVASNAQSAVSLDSNSLTIAREIYDVKMFFQELGLSTNHIQGYQYPGTPEGLLDEARQKHHYTGKESVGPIYAVYLGKRNAILVAQKSREMILETDARERSICRALASASFGAQSSSETHLQPYFLEEAFCEWVTAKYVAKKWGEKTTIAFETAIDGIDANAESILRFHLGDDEERPLEYKIPLKYVPLERQNNTFVPLLGIQGYFGYILEQLIDQNRAIEEAIIGWRNDARTLGRVFEEVRKVDPVLEEMLMSGPLSAYVSFSSLPTWQGNTASSIKEIYKLQELIEKKD